MDQKGIRSYSSLLVTISSLLLASTCELEVESKAIEIKNLHTPLLVLVRVVHFQRMPLP